MKKWFSPELRTASVVPRWSIVWTQTRDTLSSHSFFVALYAEQIGRLIEWSGRGGSWPGALMYLALTHDLDELITGDIVAPAKREILDTVRAKAYVAKNMIERLPDVVETEQHWARINPGLFQHAKLIIKAADRLDALLFLTVERRLGNTVIEPRIPECQSSLKEAWFNLPATYPGILELTWRDAVLPAIGAHRTTGGYGI